MTAYNSLSDLELVDLVKFDDQHAFAKIYERYFGLVITTRKQAG